MTVNTETDVAKTSVNEQCCGKCVTLDKQLNCKKQCFSVKTALAYHTFDLNATSTCAPSPQDALSYRYCRVINSLLLKPFSDKIRKLGQVGGKSRPRRLQGSARLSSKDKDRLARRKVEL